MIMSEDQVKHRQAVAVIRQAAMSVELARPQKIVQRVLACIADVIEIYADLQPVSKPDTDHMMAWLQARAEEGCVTMCFELDGGFHVTLEPMGGEMKAARHKESIEQAILELMLP
jgi:hypothetical protein